MDKTLQQALDEIFALPIRKLTVSNPDGGAQYKKILAEMNIELVA